LTGANAAALSARNLQSDFNQRENAVHHPVLPAEFSGDGASGLHIFETGYFRPSCERYLTAQ
jgi:hypothetical protein